MDAFDGAMNVLDDELPLTLVQASWYPPLGCRFVIVCACLSAPKRLAMLSFDRENSEIPAKRLPPSATPKDYGLITAH